MISALATEQPHIPYRNHKLTMLMSDSLGGNAKTLMFVNVSPSANDLEETQNSLTYATRVRAIINDASKNVSTKVRAFPFPAINPSAAVAANGSNYACGSGTHQPPESSS